MANPQVNDGLATPSKSLEIQMSLTTEEKEKNEWKMDPRRLSFSSPVKEPTKESSKENDKNSDEDSFSFASSEDDLKESMQIKKSKKRANVE